MAKKRKIEREEFQVVRGQRLSSHHCLLDFRSGAHFLKALEMFWAHKAIFSPSVSKNREVYTPETSCTKGTSKSM